jgi:hypothetical protein
VVDPFLDKKEIKNDRFTLSSNTLLCGEFLDNEGNFGVV